MPRKPEQVLWDSLSRVMKDLWEANRIETDTARDIPDVWFRFGGESPFTGWIELKQIPKWGFFGNKPTSVKHFTTGQKRWLQLNHRAGANCWLLLHVRQTDEYIFLDGSQAMIVGTGARRHVLANATEIFLGLPNGAAIREVLYTGRKE